MARAAGFMPSGQPVHLLRFLPGKIQRDAELDVAIRAQRYPEPLSARRFTASEACARCVLHPGLHVRGFPRLLVKNADNPLSFALAFIEWSQIWMLGHEQVGAFTRNVKCLKN